MSAEVPDEPTAAPPPRMHGSKPLPRTLANAVLDARGVHRDAFTFLDARLEPRTWTWDEVAIAAQQRCERLRGLGAQPGDRLAIIFEDNQEFVFWFLASLLGGVVAVPIQSPLPITDRAAYLDHVSRMLAAAGAQWLVCSPHLSDLSDALCRRVGGLRAVAASSEPSAAAQFDANVESSPEQTCFLQFTSGSTSDPRAVQVTHANLLENIDAAQRRVGSELGRDIGVSWLPLYHDFGLIGSVLTPLVSLGRSIIMPTLAFATRPRIWLETVQKYGATMTASTNFALRLATKRMPRVSGLDLSSLRVITIGAEPIQLEVVRAFLDAFAPYGLRETAVSPCYGLAESTLAVTVPVAGSTLKARPIPRHGAHVEGEPPQAVCCGSTIDAHELRIVAEHGVVGSDEVGEIQVRGPSVTPGYYEDARASAEVLTQDGWLRTGDLGFQHAGELYVCGRLKDLIIVQGRNYQPQQIEWEVGQVAGVRPDCVVAFSVPGEGTEKLIVVAECQHPERTHGLEAAIRARVAVRVGLNPRDVVLIRPWTLSKTSSGKLQRRKTREQYLAGTLARLIDAAASTPEQPLGARP